MPRVLWILACFALLLAECSETFESHYSDWQEAQRDGIVERGWLPEWLPPSATDIREIHDLDTNQRAFSFSVPTGWSPPETAGCVPASEATAPRFRFRQFPSHVERRPGILKCGDLFVLVTGATVAGWR